MLRSKKLLLCLIVLPTLIVSLAFTFGAVHPPRAASAFTSLTDYHVPSGLDPWGTAFASAGNVWVAVPGCNPNPDCGSKTAPGKIEEFNPTFHTWTTYTLPSGFGQALFLAFDGSGNLWFPMFHTNTLGEGFAGMIGELNMASNSVSEYSYPQLCRGCGTHASGISIDRSGLVWFDDSLQNTFGSYATGTGTFSMYTAPS